MEKAGQKIKDAWNVLMSVLPDWAKEGDLKLLSGQELVIHQAPNFDVHIKKERCTKCGECCFETPHDHTPFGSDDEFKCNALYLENGKWLCSAGQNKPYRCLADPIKKNVPNCDIRYYK